MKTKQVAITIAQMGAVILFAGGFYYFTQKQMEPTTVWQFNRDIPANTQVTEGDLVKTTIPAQAVTKGFALEAKDIVGKYNNTKLVAGEYALKKKLVDKKNIDPFESMDLTKYRKVSLPINYIDGLGGNVKRGDKVDLVFVGEGEKAGAGSTKGFKYSKAFLQDILVYNVTTDDGFRYTDRSEGVKGDEAGDMQDGKDIQTGGEGGKLSTVTLAVTLDQAEQISARLKSGSIRVVGRFDDSQNYDTAGFIVGEYDKVFSGEGLAESNK